METKSNSTASTALDAFDKKVLLGTFRQAKSITEAAKLMGISRSSLRRKAKKVGLQKECSELSKRNYKILPDLKSSLLSTKEVRKPIPIQRLPIDCSISKIKPNSLEEHLSLRGEIQKAKEEQCLKEEIQKAKKEPQETVNLSEKQSNDFFAELNTRLNYLEKTKNEKTFTEKSSVEKTSESVRSVLKKRIVEMLLTIVPILITEYNQSEN